MTRKASPLLLLIRLLVILNLLLTCIGWVGSQHQMKVAKESADFYSGNKTTDIIRIKQALLRNASYNDNTWTIKLVLEVAPLVLVWLYFANHRSKR